jgi:dihydrofolate synthase/folylpolyglutamate synthase
MVDWRERIRLNGQMIAAADFYRILSELAPFIDRIESSLVGERYFSPQGIFLAIALRWWDEQGANCAVCEVGRGGRYDDVSLVPNELALFTPILLEHTRQLGPTLTHIARHKAGIIKPGSYVYSLPQPTEVLDILQAEAEAQHAVFNWIMPGDMGEYLETTEAGIRMRLGRYGDVLLSLNGRYQVANATLAVQGAGNMHARLAGVAHSSHAYIEAIRTGLADVKWPGRLAQLDTHPAVFVDGATTVVAAQSMLESLQGRLTKPLVTIVATPADRDYPGVYRVFAAASDALILTENNVSMNVRFPPAEVALAEARKHHAEVSYLPSLAEALARARARAGREGTVLIGAALPVVAEALQLYGLHFEQI